MIDVGQAFKVVGVGLFIVQSLVQKQETVTGYFLYFYSKRWNMNL
jgi:hypothetical protein